MQRSTTRIRTSHVGLLPPPKGWEDMPAQLANAEITDPAVIAAQVTPAIAETVRKQVDIGIDCVGDGEFWTARFFVGLYCMLSVTLNTFDVPVPESAE